MKKIVFLMLVMLSLFITLKKDVTASASESNLLNPVVKYEFKEGELGVDSVNGINLKSVGNPTAGEKGVILNGSSYLYATPTNDADITDLFAIKQEIVNIAVSVTKIASKPPFSCTIVIA